MSHVFAVDLDVMRDKLGQRAKDLTLKTLQSTGWVKKNFKNELKKNLQAEKLLKTAKQSALTYAENKTPEDKRYFDVAVTVFSKYCGSLNPRLILYEHDDHSGHVDSCERCLTKFSRDRSTQGNDRTSPTNTESSLNYI